MASVGVGAWQAPETEGEKAGASLGSHHGAHPHTRVLGSTSLGAVPELTFDSKQTCHTILKVPPGYVLSGTEGVSCHRNQHHSPRWGERPCPSLPHCYLRAPHHRVSGQRAGGGIGSVSQLSLDRERGGDGESIARGRGHAEAPQRSWDRMQSQPGGR